MVITAHPERWGLLQGCVSCLTARGILLNHAHEVWCVSCLLQAFQEKRVAIVAEDARAIRKGIRLSKADHDRRVKEWKAIGKKIRPIVLERDGYACKFCRRLCEQGVDAHVDHIRPITYGGTDDLANLQSLCKDCNLEKGRLPNVYSKKLRDASYHNSYVVHSYTYFSLERGRQSNSDRHLAILQKLSQMDVPEEGIVLLERANDRPA